MLEKWLKRIQIKTPSTSAALALDSTNLVKYETYWHTVVIPLAAQADAAVKVSVQVLFSHREKQGSKTSPVGDAGHRH